MNCWGEGLEISGAALADLRRKPSLISAMALTSSFPTPSPAGCNCSRWELRPAEASTERFAGLRLDLPALRLPE